MARTRIAPPRLGHALIAALLPLTLLAGCTEDDPEPTSTDTPSTQPEPTEPTEPLEPTESEPVEPIPPAAMNGNDEAAAKAFVEYYFELVEHAQETGDTAQLRSIQLSTCGACTGVVDAITTVYEAGGSIRGGAYTVSRLTASERGQIPRDGKAFDARAIVSNTPQVIRGSGDRSLDGRQAASKLPLQFQLAHTEGSWRMLEWSQLPEKES